MFESGARGHRPSARNEPVPGSKISAVRYIPSPSRASEPPVTSTRPSWSSTASGLCLAIVIRPAGATALASYISALAWIVTFGRRPVSPPVIGTRPSPSRVAVARAPRSRRPSHARSRWPDRKPRRFVERSIPFRHHRQTAPCRRPTAPPHARSAARPSVPRLQTVRRPGSKISHERRYSPSYPPPLISTLPSGSNVAECTPAPHASRRCSRSAAISGHTPRHSTTRRRRDPPAIRMRPSFSSVIV